MAPEPERSNGELGPASADVSPWPAGTDLYSGWGRGRKPMPLYARGLSGVLGSLSGPEYDPRVPVRGGTV